jgi:Fur family transcriptional regulator, ferric uptake regulator
VVSVARPVHDEVALRLAGLEQRYTPIRRALVTTLADAGRPLSIPEILASVDELPQSSAYRTVTALIEAGVVRRVTGVDDHGRFELTEDLAGHHHHLACGSCGTVEDIAPSPRLERAMAEAARVVAEEQGYEVTSHQFDLVGVCSRCQALPG